MKSKHRTKPKSPNAAVQAGSPVVSAAYAKLKFADLLKAVERGETVTIHRYNRPIAKLSPAEVPVNRQFGFLKGLVEIVDPDWDKKQTLTKEEIDALGKANY
jgi:prevent-host-death family protein